MPHVYARCCHMSITYWYEASFIVEVSSTFHPINVSINVLEYDTCHSPGRPCVICQ